MPERTAVSPQLLSEVLETQRRIERGVSLIAWRPRAQTPRT